MESRIEQHVCSVQIALGVPTKAPIAGVAKTRLGRGLGYEVAAKLHRAFLLDAIAMLGRVSARLGRVGRFLMCPDQQQAEIVRGFVGQSLTVEVQTRTGLMGCLTDVFDTGFGSGAQYAAAIASDIPGLPEGHILRCLDLARRYDLVLGPDNGGGYYLIAARRAAWSRVPDLLLGKPYDGATIRTATMEQASALGMTAAEGPAGYDIDTIEDLAILIERDLPEAANTMRYTRAALDEFAGELSLPVSVDNPTVRSTLTDVTQPK